MLGRRAAQGAATAMVASGAPPESLVPLAPEHSLLGEPNRVTERLRLDSTQATL